MTATAQDIVADDLSRRIPLTKGDADLKRLAAAFNKMLDRISALLEANKHVSSAIAHDLRKPLARVLRGLETVRSGPADLAKYGEAVDAARATSTESLKLLARCCGSDKSKPGLGLATSRKSIWR